MSLSKSLFRASSGVDVEIIQHPGKTPGLVFLGGFGAAHDLFEKGQFFLKQCQDKGIAFTAINWQTPEDGLISQWRTHLFEALQISGKPQVIVGSSFGAWIAALAAKDLEDAGKKNLVKGMVFINPAFDALHIAEQAIGKNGAAYLAANPNNSVPLKTPSMPKPFTLKQVHLTDGRNSLFFSGAKVAVPNVETHIFHAADDLIAPIAFSKAFTASTSAKTTLKEFAGGHDLNTPAFLSEVWEATRRMITPPAPPQPAAPRRNA